jgi:sugar O-acyltransferase (sialic acid O-acetyltransferase NeuD family)
MEKIVVIGSMGHAKVIIDSIEKARLYEIAGIIDTNRAEGEKVLGYTVLGGDDDLPDLIDDAEISGGVIAIGDNCTRAKVVDQIRDLIPDFRFVSVVHPDGSIARGVTIGQGTVVMAGVRINTDAVVGNFCILNTNASLDHDSRLGNFASLAPNAATGGNTIIEEGVAIGIGATVSHGVTIGKHTIVGAGAVVLTDLTEHVVAFGTPAKPVRSRKIGDPYLH